VPKVINKVLRSRKNVQKKCMKTECQNYLLGTNHPKDEQKDSSTGDGNPHVAQIYTFFCTVSDSLMDGERK
jgi:hypothetical protein